MLLAGLLAACSTVTGLRRGDGRTGSYRKAPSLATASEADHRAIASRLAKVTAERAQALSAFRAQARLRYEGPKDKFKSSQMIVIKSPNRVRIDIMGPFGPSYTVASDGLELTAYDRGEKVLYIGKASVENVQRYVRVGLGVPMLAWLLRGLPPAAELGSAEVSRWNEGWVLHTRLKGGRAMWVRFDGETSDPVYVKIAGVPGHGEIEAYFSKFRRVDGVRTPYAVEVRLADGGRAKLVYEKIWRDVAISDDAFRINPARGVRYVDMDEIP